MTVAYNEVRGRRHATSASVREASVIRAGSCGCSAPRAQVRFWRPTGI